MWETSRRWCEKSHLCTHSVTSLVLQQSASSSTTFPSDPAPLHPQGYKSDFLVPRILCIALSGLRGTGNLPALGTAAFCKYHQDTLASSSAIPHSSSCPYLGHMPFNPGHLWTSHLFIWSNTSWIILCIYMDGCCIPARSSYQRFLSKRLERNRSNKTQMKAAPLIQGS